MLTKRQSFLPGFNDRSVAIAHGGNQNQGRRKSRRPIDPKQALHVVLRSSKARGSHSLLQPKTARSVHTLTQNLAKRWGVKVYRYANVGNHIHLLIKVPSRLAWQRFLRELAGGIAMKVSGAKKGCALDKNESGRGFWDHLAFTRIVHFGRDFEKVAKYLIKNLFESLGVPMKQLLARGLKVMDTEDIGKPLVKT